MSEEKKAVPTRHPEPGQLESGPEYTQETSQSHPRPRQGPRQGSPRRGKNNAPAAHPKARVSAPPGETSANPPSRPPGWGPTGGTLATQVRLALEEYIQHLNGEQPVQLYKLVISEVERPLLEIVMQHVEGNQIKAAALLGIHRVTLRKRLIRCGLLQSPPPRRTGTSGRRA